MSEKRFSLKKWEDVNYCEHCFYDGESALSDDDVVDLLNEQQSTINEQKEAIEYLKTVIRYTIPNQMVADVFKEICEEYE